MSEIPDPESPDEAAIPIGKSELADQWLTVFDEVKLGLRSFLRSRLPQESDVDDCLQVVFVKMTESGRDVAPASRRAWLFRVAANESARWWRSTASTEKTLQRHGAAQPTETDPIDDLIYSERNQQLHQAVDQLPAPLRDVVRLRINENLTFQQIADKLDIPLGTALTRMRRALDRLRRQIDSEQP